MKYILLIVFAFFATPAFAKRGPAPKVPPLEHNGIRFVAPNDDGMVAHLEAWDIQTGTKLWTTSVFRNRFKKGLEPDVQYVFIKKLEVVEDSLVVTDERGRTYLVDLESGRVQSSILRWIIVAAIAVTLLVLLIFVIWRSTSKPGAK